jgi:hypothetical protein
MESVREKAAEAKHRYDNLETNLKEADKLSDEVATLEKPEAINVLQDRIDALEKGADADAQDIARLQKGGKPEAAMAKMHDMNGKNVQLRSLKDTLAVTKGDKNFYDRQGNVVTSPKSADFVVPADKKLVKEGNEMHLLSQKDTLSDANRQIARQDFKSAQSDLSSTRTHVAASRQIELGVSKASQVNQQLQASNQPVAGAQAPRNGTMESLPDTPGVVQNLNRPSPTKQ